MPDRILIQLGEHLERVRRMPRTFLEYADDSSNRSLRGQSGFDTSSMAFTYLPSLMLVAGQGLFAQTFVGVREIILSVAQAPDEPDMQGRVKRMVFTGADAPSEHRMRFEMDDGRRFSYAADGAACNVDDTGEVIYQRECWRVVE